MKIVGYHIQEDTIASSDNELCGQPPFLEFLLKDKGEYIKVFYHLDYAVANLIMMLGFEPWEIKKLSQKGEFWKNGYVLQYIPHKWFSIKKNGQYAGFSDMSQYLDWHLSPNDNCKTRAMEAEITGHTVYQALQKAGIAATTLTSPVGTFEKSIMPSLNLPTCSDIPDEVNQYAYECCHGSWLETFKKGHWDTIYDYDISAAYPYFTRELLDIRFGNWIKSKEYVSDVMYGFCKGIVSIWKTPSPIICQVSKNSSYNPVGEWECYLTKDEIDFINRHNIGKFDIEDGWWWTPDTNKKPLLTTINDLYNIREKLSGLEKEVVKRISTGIWGKFGEVWNDGTLGNYFNPVWMSQVETSARLEVARFIYSHDLAASVLSIAVDGVTSSCPVHNLSDNGMGKWRLTSTSPGFIISSGVVALKENQANKDFSLRYDWLMDQIKNNPLAKQYTMKKLSPVTISKAVNRNKYDNLGDVEEITKYVDIVYEAKRDYPELPECGKDLLENKYDSFAFDVSRLRIEELENDITDWNNDRLSSVSVLERRKVQSEDK